MIMSPDGLTPPRYCPQHFSVDDDPFTSTPSTPSSSDHHLSESSPALASTPQPDQTGTTYKPSIDSFAPAPSPHLPGWYPSTPQPGSSALSYIELSQHSHCSSIRTCSLDDGYLTANQTPVSARPRRGCVTLSSGSSTSASSDDRTGPSIDLHNLNQHLLIQSPLASDSASSSQLASLNSHSVAFSTSNRMIGSENMDRLNGNRPIHAAAFLGDLGHADQVIETSPQVDSPATRLSLPDSTASSGSPSLDAFAYRTIGPAIVLRTYQPNHSLRGINVYQWIASEDYSRISTSSACFLSSAVVTRSIPSPVWQVPRSWKGQASIQPCHSSRLINRRQKTRQRSNRSDEIVAPYASSPAHNPTRSIDEGDVSHQNLDSPEGLFGQPVTGPLAVGIPDSNSHGTELSAHSSCGTQVSTPGPQGIDVAVLENLTDPAEHSSDSHPDKSSETPPTRPSTLPQEDVNGTALTEVQDDLMTFDHEEASAGNLSAINSPKLAPDVERPPASEPSPTFRNDLLEDTSESVQAAPSDLSSSDTLNEPRETIQPAVGRPDEIEAPAARSTDAFKETVVESTDASTTDSAAAAAPQSDTGVAPESHLIPASRRGSILEPNASEHDAQADQSPATTSESHTATNTLNTSEPMVSENTIPQAPASEDTIAKVPEEFLVVAGLDPEQAPADVIHLTPAATSVDNDETRTKPLEPSHVHDGPVSQPQISSSDLPTVSFPTSRSTENNAAAWSLNPTTRMSSSTEIVDPLLRSNICNESGGLVAAVESQGRAIGETKKAAPGHHKHGFRTRSVSGFFKSLNKKEVPQADAGQSPSTASIHSSDEDTRASSAKGLTKMKSLGMLKRKSGIPWASRSPSEPVPPLPKPKDFNATNDHKLEHPSQSDEKLKIPSPADITVPSTNEAKVSKSPRQFKVSLAKRYFKSEPTQPAATNGLTDTLEGPFSSVIGGIGYSPSAPRAKTLIKKRRTLSARVPTPVLKDLKLSGIISKILGRKTHMDEIVQGA
ncbi:hypothetical protein PSTT_13038 [Puccinia striiformis]|uniref:Uncharacterized protein n=1 Tax=Puccinia striiformis TaxID=27350 RepID=A0A2S4UTL8_9BASI|nr:hypothetical protein PSTT_13038 [Puccinia striiformis]